MVCFRCPRIAGAHQGPRSGGRPEQLLVSVGDELRQLGLDKVCRVDDFVAPVWQGASVAAPVLEPGLSLSLGLAGDGAAVMQDWY